jgi:hypothetical protein
VVAELTREGGKAWRQCVEWVINSERKEKRVKPGISFDNCVVIPVMLKGGCGLVVSQRLVEIGATKT